MFPFCGVMAFKRAVFDNLRWGIALWSVLALIGSQALSRRQALDDSSVMTDSPSACARSTRECWSCSR